MGTAEEQDGAKRMERTREAISRLPENNGHFLHAISILCHTIAEHKEVKNKKEDDGEEKRNGNEGHPLSLRLCSNMFCSMDKKNHIIEKYLYIFILLWTSIYNYSIYLYIILLYVYIIIVDIH